MKVAYLGLGVMGAPMAGWLVKAGHEVVAWNRTKEKSVQWLAANEKDGHANMAETASSAVKDAEIVFCCIGNDDDLRGLCLGDEGVLTSMKAGAVFVDHTTASASVARELNEAAKAVEVSFIDAPVSGGQAGAENGQLTVMCGGGKDSFETAEPIIRAYAKQCKLMGNVGAGQLTKMVNQICIGGLLQGLSEAITFAQKADLDVEAVIDVISKGAAQSWQMENRYQTMVEGKYDHGFAVDWMRKDFSIVLDEAQRNGASLPVTALVDQFYADVQAMGGGRWDTSSLLARLQKINP